MTTMQVEHLDGDRFAVLVRDHVITVDQPIDAGGTDTAPTPTELFIASLATCVAFYAHRYLVRHALPTKGLAVTVEHTMGERPARVSEVRLRLRLPAGIDADRRAPLLAVASHCTVHNTLVDAPSITIALADEGAPAPADR